MEEWHINDPGRDLRKDAPSALRDAEAHLRASLRPNGQIDENDWDYPDREKAEIYRWAETEGLILPENFAGPEKSGGREHDLRFDPQTGRWWKFTKKNASGYAVEWDEQGEPFMISAFRKDGYDVWDVHPANVVLDVTSGLPLPFDVIVRPAP